MKPKIHGPDGAAVRFVRWDSPCGELELASLGKELVMCDWVDGWHRRTKLNRLKRMLGMPFEEGASPVIDEALAQLGAYFERRLKRFTVPLRLIGTDFQIRVWRELEKIPYGSLATYGEIAAGAGSPAAVRACGVAVGANPMSILIPCHRVIGRDGTLTGYGGGYGAKRLLLALELGIAPEELTYPDGTARRG